MQNNFKINRPLLNVHRFEIRQFVRFWKLPIYSDQSNQKTNFLRNKIRKQLMPTLRIFFNPQIDAVLLNFIEIKKNEQLYFQSVLNLLLKPQQPDPLFIFSFSDKLAVGKQIFDEASLYEPYLALTITTSCFTSTTLSQPQVIDTRQSQQLPSVQVKVETKRIRKQPQIQCKDYLCYFSRNQIIHWLIINNNLTKRLNSYPIVFQKQVLKTLFKTFNGIENILKLKIPSSQSYNFTADNSGNVMLPTYEQSSSNKAPTKTTLFSCVTSFAIHTSFASKESVTRQASIGSRLKNAANRSSSQSSSQSSYQSSITRSEALTNRRFVRPQIEALLEVLRRIPQVEQSASICYATEGGFACQAKHALNAKHLIRYSQIRTKHSSKKNSMKNATVSQIDFNKMFKKSKILGQVCFDSKQYYSCCKATLPRVGRIARKEKQILLRQTKNNKTLNEKNLTQLLIVKFIKKLFILREKKLLLFMIRNLINKY